MPRATKPCANPLCNKVTYGHVCRNCHASRQFYGSKVVVDARESWWLQPNFYDVAKQQVSRMLAANVYIQPREID